MLKKLRHIALKAARLKIEEGKFIAVGVTTSVARGDVWIASDVDLLAIAEGDPEKTYSSQDLGGVRVDWLIYSKNYLDELIQGYPDSFVEKRLPNLLYECQVIHDTNQTLGPACNFVRRNRFDPLVIGLRAGNCLDRSKRSLFNTQEAVEREDVISAILWLREASYFAVSVLIELCQMLPNKRGLISQIRKCTQLLNSSCLWTLYDSINHLQGLDKDKTDKIVVSFNNLVSDLTNHLQRMGNQKKEEKIQNFMSLSKMYYPRFIKGLRLLAQKGEFKEASNLAEVELRYRIGEIITHLNPELGGDTTRAPNAKDVPPGFRDQYLTITRVKDMDLSMRSIESKNKQAEAILQIAEKELTKVDQPENHLSH